MAPTIQNPACQEQLVDSCKQVARSVDHVVTTADDVCDDEPSLGNLREAATAVSRALDDLLKHIRSSGARGNQVCIGHLFKNRSLVSARLHNMYMNYSKAQRKKIVVNL